MHERVLFKGGVGTRHAAQVDGVAGWTVGSSLPRAVAKGRVLTGSGRRGGPVREAVAGGDVDIRVRVGGLDTLARMHSRM